VTLVTADRLMELLVELENLRDEFGYAVENAALLDALTPDQRFGLYWGARMAQEDFTYWASLADADFTFVATRQT
jgi:hypothetical protein